MNGKRDVRLNLSWNHIGIIRGILRTQIDRVEQWLRVYPDADNREDMLQHVKDMQGLLALFEAPIERLVARARGQ